MRLDEWGDQAADFEHFVARGSMDIDGLGSKTIAQLIEKGEAHRITNTGRSPLVTLNFYVPPAYTSEGEELPAGQS